MLILIDERVGFVVVLALFVRFLDIAISYTQAHRYGWAAAYGAVCLLLLASALVALGFHT